MKSASRETDMAKKYPSNANTKKASELIAALERDLEGLRQAGWIYVAHWHAMDACCVWVCW